jgi:ABC-2 type transport system permease protein
MVIMKDPEGARKMGMIGAKARLTGEADWPTYFSLLTQTVAMGGMVVYSFIAAWVFGREYSDGTLRNLLAVPTPRAAIVGAKLTLVALWCSALSLLVLVLGMLVGGLVGLPGFSIEGMLEAVSRLTATAVMTIALLSPLALFAGIGRGYLAPLGFAFLSLFIAQISAAMGWGAFVPWAIPALYSGISGPRGEAVGALSFLIVALTSLAGVVATLVWWKRSDHTV